MLRSMRLSLALISGLIIITTITTPLSAHGPTRQKMKKAVIINAEPAKVWAVIQNFNDMSWHPAIAKTEGKGGNAIDATRILTLKGGGIIKEVLYKYSADKMSYSYRITDVDVKVLPVKNYSSHLTVKPQEGGKTMVVWRGAYYRGFMNNDPPPELNEEAANKAVAGVYESGLKALKEKIEAGQ